MRKLVLTMMALLSVTAVTAQTDNRERKAPKEMTPAHKVSAHKVSDTL
jgi:hypothetical protein